MITRIQEVQRQPASASLAWLPPRTTAALQGRRPPRARRHDPPPSRRLGQQPAAAAALPPCHSGGAAGRRHLGSMLARSSTPAAEAAVSGAAPVEQANWRAMLMRAWGLLQRQLWPLVVAHAATDTLVFMLHRFSHRATNEAAVALLGGGMLTQQAIGNMWYLSVDPAIANFQTGYQPLTFLFFLLAFPLNVYIKTWASVATILLCQQVKQAWAGSTEAPAAAAAPPDQTQEELAQQVQQQQQQQEKEQHAQPQQEQQQQAQQNGNATEPKTVAAWWQPHRGLRQALAALGPLRAQIAALWRPVFLVELLVAVVVVPLQFASLVVVTLPLTLPIILDLQAAGPVAVAEGARGMGAVNRSRQMLRPLRWQLAIPFVGLLVAGRLLQAVKESLLNSMPARYFLELPEIPLAVAVGGTVLSVLMARLQDVLPFVAWEAAAEREAREEEAAVVQAKQTTDEAATTGAAHATGHAERGSNGAASSTRELSK